MYSTKQPTNKKETTLDKIGKVQIQDRGSSYRLKFVWEGKQRAITVPGGKNKESLAKAKAIASEINSDLIWGRFDATLVKYGLAKTQPQPSPSEISAISPNLPTLRDVWESYKAIKGKVPINTQKVVWARIEKILTLLPSELLTLSSASRVIPWLKSEGSYSETTIDRCFQTLESALSLAKKQGLIAEIPYYGREYLKPNKRETNCKAFSESDLKAILSAFKEDTLVKPSSRFTHSHYYNFVLFRLLTGCRPEDALALTWKDIKTQNERDVIIFSKAYSGGELGLTKVGKKKGTAISRIFPINDQLRECLENQAKHLTTIPNPHNLIFPSANGNYMDLKNFVNRIWRPVVTELVKQGKVSEYLPFYNLRHNCATFLIRQGIDLQTIATLLETSIEMLQKHYLASDKGVNLPNVPFLE